MEAGEKKLTDVTTNYFNEKMIKKNTQKGWSIRQRRGWGSIS